MNSTPEPTSSASADNLRATLRADLTAAMKARQPEVVSALRTTLAAVDNAEAVDATGSDGAGSEHMAGATTGVGSTERRRRTLTAADVHDVLNAQIAERLTEADTYTLHGQSDAADRLRREAAALAKYVAG